MRQYRALALILAMLTASPFSFAADTEQRLIGGPGALNQGDLYLGSSYYDTVTLGRRVYGINANTFGFPQDNAIKVGNANLYGLSLGVMGAWKMPYFGAAGAVGSVSIGATGLCWKSTGASSAPTWGECGTGSGSSTDNVFLNLQVTEGSALLDNGATIPDDIPIVLGTQGWTMKFVSADNAMRFTTAATVGKDDDTPIFSIVVNSAGGTVDTGQKLFSIRDYITDLFWVLQGGSARFLGEVTASSYATTGTDNTFRINIANSGNVDNSIVSGGDMWFSALDNTINIRSLDNTATLKISVDP